MQIINNGRAVRQDLQLASDHIFVNQRVAIMQNVGVGAMDACNSARFDGIAVRAYG